MRKSGLLFAAAIVMFVSSAWAQAPATPPSALLKVEVTISRYMGSNKVSSHLYSLSLVPNESGSIKVGAEVPVPGPYVPNTSASGGAATATPNPQPSYTMQYVGTQIDGNAVLQPDGRYKLRLTVTDRSALTNAQGTEQGARVANVPAFRNVVFGSTIYLRDGQSTQFSSATDKVTGEVFKVDVLLAVEK